MGSGWNCFRHGSAGGDWLRDLCFTLVRCNRLQDICDSVVSRQLRQSQGGTSAFRYCQEIARGGWLDLASIDTRLRSLILVWIKLSDAQRDEILTAAINCK